MPVVLLNILSLQFLFLLKMILMNFRPFTTFIVLSLFIISFSCSNQSEKSRKPAVKISVESTSGRMSVGSDLKIDISVKVKGGELQETKIYVDSTLVTTNTATEFTYLVPHFKELGQHTIKAVATKTGGVEGVYFKNFEVLSDIVPEEYGFEVVQTLPHNDSYFTEGLEIHEGFLYESTGELGTSGIYKTNLKTGKVIQSTPLASRYFGEGITIFNNRVYQLTYKSKIGFIYHLENMAVIDSFYFSSAEGWGMTHDDRNVIMSDGTNILTYMDPVSMKTVKTVQVCDNKQPMSYLNELEYSDGAIYANIWNTFLIVKIDPATGKVLSKIHMDGILNLLPNGNRQVDVLNGIAIDPTTKKMYVTGKYYSKLFEIRLVKK
jgi:glutamine cyclotransferase